VTDQSSGLTFADLINQGAAKLKSAGLDAARYEARILFLWAADLNPTALISAEQNNASDALIAKYQAAIDRRAAGEPFQHIVGTTEFYGLEFLSDKRALIPRPDSECVVELALEMLPNHTPLNVADLGTGSGALLSAILSHRPQAFGMAIERSPQAASLAEENFKALDLSPRTTIFRSSWTDWQGWDTCDLIISNPPYIESAVIPRLQAEVRDHDPMDALDGGADGLDAYREIITLGAAQMKAGAHLVLEIGYDQKDVVSALLHAAGFMNLKHRKDLGGNDRAIAAIRP
jgi:release factor glutamine methyltransferase